MRSFKLFWRVILNFFLLVTILTITTILTLNVLSQIEKNFTIASVDINTLQTLERFQTLCSDIRQAADAYMLVPSEEKRNKYDECWKEFDLDIATAQQSFPDSLDRESLKEIRSLFHAWVVNIGDNKILLASEKLSPEGFSSRARQLVQSEQSARYLDNATLLVKNLYNRKLTAVPQYIETSIGFGKRIRMYIIFVNVLLAIFSLALGFFLTRSLTRPLARLQEGTHSIMKGEFTHIDLHRHDELGNLADDFNQMSTLLQNNYQRINAYSELMTTLNRHEGLASVQGSSIEMLCQHTHASVGALYLWNTDKNILQIAAGYALRTEAAIQSYQLGEGIPGQCAAKRIAIDVNDVGLAKDFVIDTGIVSVAPEHILATPILFQENLLGVLLLGSTQPFDELRHEIIKNSVPQIGVAITNAMNFESTKRLSHEVAAKNDELNTKNAELQKAYRVKSDFLSNMSHELRTPLNSIIGFTSVLLEPHGDPLTDDTKTALGKVLKNGKHLLQLINDILDYSKIESGRMSINVDSDEVANVIANCLVTVEPMVTAKGVKLQTQIEDGLPTLQTDSLKVKQILLNLLSNAAKFTDHGAITVIAKKHNNLVSIAVKDDGIGIEEKNLGSVFEEFQQIDSSNSRKHKGTGLGLAIARNYARLLGGDLSVQSIYGTGSTFTLILPPVFSQEQIGVQSHGMPSHVSSVVTPVQQLRMEQQPVSTSGALVLCIDDESDVIELMKRYLIPEGYSVHAATSGDEGIRLAEQLHPSVITLDIMMPVKDGWQVLRELKNNPKTKDIPVIIHSIIDNKPLAISLGALDVITKPSDSKLILAVVERACHSKDQTILLVDDDGDFSDVLRQLLQREGYRTLSVLSGEEALKTLEYLKPALIFLDLKMPGMDGFAVLEHLRADDRWQDIPVVILSGADVSEPQRAILQQNAQDFIEKGKFSKELISQTIKRTIAR
jgi:signal transduction histidine kinase/DNA-binding response OmpR family regulator